MDQNRQLSAIMFTDIVGYTGLMQNDETTAIQVRIKHRNVFNEITGKYHGKILQYYGDGTLSIFNSTTQAVRCAVAIQQEMRKAPVVPLRIGIHSADIIFNGDEVIGNGVNIASRIESIAVEGGVLISEKVHDDIKNQKDIQCLYLGKASLKNVKDPIGIYAIVAEGLAVPEYPLISVQQTGQSSMHGSEETPAIIGRDQEIKEMMPFFRDLEAGRAGAIILSGESGVGKTALLRHVLPLTHTLKVETRCPEEQSLAYGPFVQAIRFLSKASPGNLKDSLPSYEHLSLILPEIEASRITPNGHSLQNAIAEFFQVASQQNPMVLIIEDLQWADGATIDTLPKLFDQPGTLPLLFIGTMRSGFVSTDHRLRWIRSELRRLPNFREIELRLLTEPEISEMLTSILGKKPDAAFSENIYEKSRGLPLFAEELAKALKDKGYLQYGQSLISMRQEIEMPVPETIRDTVALQLDGLTVEARSLLEHAATIGMEFEMDMLGDLTDDESAIDELLQRQLIFEQANGKGAFKHNLILDSIRKDILWSRRRALNRRIAEVLEMRGAPSHIAGEYWLKGGEKQKAIDAFVDAANHYCKIHAHSDAALLAGKAMELWPAGQDESRRHQVLMQYAQCTRINGQISESILALKEILESDHLDDEYRQRADTSRMIASCYALTGHWQEYKKHRHTAAEMFEQASDWVEAARDWHELSNRYIDELRVSDALEVGARAILNAEKSRNPTMIVKTLSGQGYALSMAGRKEEALKIARSAFDRAKVTEDIESTVYAYRKLAGVFEYASDFKESIETFDTALNFCYREDMNIQAMLCMSCMSWVMFRLGQWNKAMEVCKKVIEDPEVNDTSKSTAYGVMALIHTFRGTLKTARKYHRQAWELAGSVHSEMLLNIGRWGLAVYLEYSGKTDEAFIQYSTMIEEWQKTEDKHDILVAFCSAGVFYGEYGHKVEVVKCVAHCAQIAEETGNPEAMGVLSLCLGISSHLLEQHEESATHLKNALRYFRKLDIPLQVTFAEYQLGKAYRALGQIEEAVLHWKSAVKLCNNMGLRPLAGILEKALADAGAPTGEVRNPNHETRKQRGGLTARQFEILACISEGLSNKEIAARLHISTRTVDMHVRNLFDALNCRSRAEAVKTATDQGILS